MLAKTVEHSFDAFNTSPRVAKFRITPAHPDFVIAQGQSCEARRLGNSLNYVARKVYDQRAYNREFNKTVTDKRKRIRNTHTKIDRLFDDPELLAMGVVGWLKKNKGCVFTHKHNFGGLTKPVSVWLDLQLPVKVAQLVGGKLAESQKSYHELLIRFYADPKLNQKPSPPGYKKQFGYVEYTKQAINSGQKSAAKQESITQVVPSGWTVGVKLPAGLTLADVSSARLTALHATAFELEVIYDVRVQTPDWPDLQTVKANKKIPLTAYTDLGVDVLGAFVFSDGRTPLLVNGKPLKAINAWANKQNTKIRAVHDTERRNTFIKQKSKAYQDEVDMPVYPSTIPSKKLDRLWQTRNDHVDNYLHTP